MGHLLRPLVLLVIRLGFFEPAINIINYYGKQETKQTSEEINEGWEEIRTEIDNIKAKNETYVLAGDLNRHLGSYIPGNNPKVSTAGKLLIEFLEDEENILVNSTGMRNISEIF